MLQLKEIVKDYRTGDEVVKALKCISINFRKMSLCPSWDSRDVVRLPFLI